MGSKNLKAIAVRGTGEIAVADPSRFFSVVDKEREKYTQSNSANLRMEYGSAGSVYNKQKVCGIPYKNFQYLVLPEESLNRFNLEDLQKRYMTRHVGYLACPAPCSSTVAINRG